MAHAFVTVVVPFDDSRSVAVNAHLDALGNLARPPLSETLNASAFVHFMSLTVVRDSSGGSAYLVLEASADGYPGGVLNRLAREIGPELCRVLALAGVHVPESQLGEFLVRHDRQVGQGWFAVSGVVFTGTPGMTVGRIRREAELAARIQQILDDLPAQGSALATLERVRAHLFGEAVYKWAFVAEPMPLLADAPYRSRPGFLSNIGTIHFARWILLPGTDKLLFFSNYTGSWESYLEDFILRAHEGLTGIWSNTQGFPRTKNLVQDGAKDGDRFKRWARRQQHPTRFWYAAYPALTTLRVRTNAAIRDGFATASTEADAARWLVHFRFAPPKVSTVESDHIPTLVFG